MWIYNVRCFQKWLITVGVERSLCWDTLRQKLNYCWKRMSKNFSLTKVNSSLVAFNQHEHEACLLSHFHRLSFSILLLYFYTKYLSNIKRWEHLEVRVSRMILWFVRESAVGGVVRYCHQGNCVWEPLSQQNNYSFEKYITDLNSAIFKIFSRNFNQVDID